MRLCLIGVLLVSCRCEPGYIPLGIMNKACCSRMSSVVVVAVLSGCGQCSEAPLQPTGEGEGDIGEGEGDTSEGEGEVGEGEGDFGEGEGEGEPTATCIFDEGTVFDFTCEGDEDWCDDVGSQRVAPLSDIVATWGRIEGDKVILEARFAMLPGRTPRTEISLFLHTGWGFGTPYGTGDLSAVSPYVGTIECDSGRIIIGSTPPFTYPLTTFTYPLTAGAYGTLPQQHPYDPCSIFISPDKPYYRFVFDATDADV
jgi:hypothetical protein